MAELLELGRLYLYNIQILLCFTTSAGCNDSHPYKQLIKWWNTFLLLFVLSPLMEDSSRSDLVTNLCSLNSKQMDKEFCENQFDWTKTHKLHNYILNCQKKNLRVIFLWNKVASTAEFSQRTGTIQCFSFHTIFSNPLVKSLHPFQRGKVFCCRKAALLSFSLLISDVHSLLQQTPPEILKSNKM